MTRYKSLALSLSVAVVILTVAILGPAQAARNGVQILEFGTSTSFAETTENNLTSIEAQSEKPATAGANTGTPAAEKGLTTENAASSDANQNAMKEKSAAERAKAIADGTPLDKASAEALIRYADEYDLNPSLILSVIEVESNFNQWEVGTSRDRGYMQIIPATEKWLAKSFGKELGLQYDPEQIFDPEYNIGLAAAYLNLLRENYGDDYSRILSEYNRGPSNLKRYYQKHGTYSTGYSRKVLSAEKKYVAYND